ncbi:MAG: twin-arginine translocase TatA/TatE family subunit [Deltaproteobacteria bacterium]|nr:twin-arginine translocase TatA/TatE family subunit [Deltaproteobacteria bacterium]
MVICFIIVGPKKMTEIAFEAGKILGKLKDQLRQIKDIRLDSFDHIENKITSPAKNKNKDPQEQSQEPSQEQPELKG